MPREIYRDQITSEENWSKVNPKNIQLYQKFLKYKNNSCSDTTVKGYDSDLQIFFTWNLLYNDNKHFSTIKKIEFSDFFSFGVSDLKWGTYRYSRIRSCLSSFSDFFEKFFGEEPEYKDFRNIINKVIDKVPKSPKHKKTILTEEQVNNLLNYLSNEVKKPEEACLLALAIGCGARVSELLRINPSLIDENNLAFDDIFIETSEEIKTKGFGKAGKPLYKYIIKDIFVPYYHVWLEKRKEIMEKNNKDHDYLFVKSNGEPAKVSTIRSWIRKWEAFLGVPFYPHCLRHYITTYLSRLGLSSDFIVEVMGWSSPAMYNVYCDLTAKEKKWKDLGKLKDAIDKVSVPINNTEQDDNEESQES
jgi:site-specific recombinase XerD